MEAVPVSPAPRRLKVGNFILRLENIGKGSSSEVRSGTHAVTGAPVAVKVMEKAWIIRNRCGPSVAREVALMARFNHPNVVKLVEVMNSRTHVYVVMEMIEGRELYDVIVSRGHLPEEEAGGFFGQLVRGLSYIHAMGVSHRDLKPENLLITAGGHLKIIDFGLSASLEYEPADAAAAAGKNNDRVPAAAAAGLRRHRRLRTICGTPFYTAPEVFRVNGRGGSASGGYDGRCADVWSAGVVLFAMLAGRLPFEGADVPETLRLIEKQRLAFPETVPEEARGLISAMLSKDPNKRPSLAAVAAHPWLVRHDKPPAGIKIDEVRSPCLVDYAEPPLPPLALTPPSIDSKVEPSQDATHALGSSLAGVSLAEAAVTVPGMEAEAAAAALRGGGGGGGGGERGRPHGRNKSSLAA